MGLGLLGVLRRLPDAAGDLAHGLLQVLHGAGLLHRALAESLGGVGHLVGPVGHILGAGDDLPHGAVELLENVVEGGADGGEVPHVLLGDLGGQVAPGNRVEHAGDLPDVISQALDGPVKALGQYADFIVRVDVHHHRLVLVQAQIALLQRLGQHGQAEEGPGDGPLYVRADYRDSRQNEQNPEQKRQHDCQIDLPEGL